ncbi:hypothetical protein [Sphingomonas sp. Leaf357]|uniref:hypothetical protein n=1 Tax=Sphingomonas sp. Leaf357 TaxID=1736350 RepID=UPI0012E325D1|nr:hypothetical protein [Sphingomonas sp. Leaf357]
MADRFTCREKLHPVYGQAEYRTISTVWLTGTHHASRKCNMGNGNSSGNWRNATAIGVGAVLAAVIRIVRDFLALAIAGFRKFVAEPDRAADVFECDRLFQNAFANRPRDRHDLPVGIQASRASGRPALRSGHPNTAFTTSVTGNTGTIVSVFSRRSENTYLNGTHAFKLIGMFFVSVRRALRVGVLSAEASSLYAAAGGGTSKFRTGGYFIPT